MRTSYHKRENMDDMLTAVKDIPTATAFLAKLSEPVTLTRQSVSRWK